MKNDVLVTVIMPVYNSEKYIRDCVNSILQEKGIEFELLLIDDGSVDHSPEICDELGRQDSRVRVYHKPNGGICEARNFGIKHAKGEYIAFSDHDDRVNVGFIVENYLYAKATQADVVKFGRKALIIKEEITKKIDIRRFKKRVLSNEEIKKEFLKLRFEGAMTCVWDGFFRKDFLERNSIIFDTDYKKGGEDIDFCSKCFSCSTKIAFNEGVYYEHYIRVGYSTSTKPDDRRLNKFLMLTQNLDYCVDKLSVEKNQYYFLNIVKDLVYPSMAYFNGMGATYSTVKDFMTNKCDKYRMNAPGFLKLILANPKWGIYAVLFKYGLYKIMYKSLSYRRKRK